MSDALIAAAAGVVIADAAGRILANPARNAIAASAAEVLALAWAAENYWSVCVEADLLVRALAVPTDTFTSEEQFDLRDHTIQTQADAIARLMAAMRGETPAPEKE